jgi:predicted DNA binding CopG/RHH family protein/DNA-binding XRE family transcriptional regulator
MSKFKKLPEFTSEAEERKFWETHDSADYVDWSEAAQVRFPKLKPSTRSISIRLPESLLEEVQILANKNDVPYQSLIKMLIAQSLHTGKNEEHKTIAKVFNNIYKVLKSRQLQHKSTPHVTDVEIGSLLQQYRKAMHLGKEEFARKIHVKTAELNAIERGDKSVFGTKIDNSIERAFEEDSRDSV